ncbi:hypothetical protein [Phaeodactylibacter luteus]|nr:hypothetical protein [Phaeodactylibacter luteus]
MTEIMQMGRAEGTGLTKVNHWNIAEPWQEAGTFPKDRDQRS